MKVLVVIGHQNPKHDSFCHALAGAAVETLRAEGHEVIYHDLYEESFDAILPHGEVLKGGEVDPVVQRHIDELRSADGIVVVHPNWWAQPPAILKGWIDRVFRQGLIYAFGPGGTIIGHLAGKTALVLSTSNTPREAELQLYGDPLENWWRTCVFGFCGLTNFRRRNFESIVMSSAEQRQGWLQTAREIVREMFPRAA